MDSSRSPVLLEFIAFGRVLTGALGEARWFAARKAQTDDIDVGLTQSTTQTIEPAAGSGTDIKEERARARQRGNEAPAEAEAEVLR